MQTDAHSRIHKAGDRKSEKRSKKDDNSATQIRGKKQNRIGHPSLHPPFPPYYLHRADQIKWQRLSREDLQHPPRDNCLSWDKQSSTAVRMNELLKREMEVGLPRAKLLCERRVSNCSEAHILGPQHAAKLPGALCCSMKTTVLRMINDGNFACL
eukprot:2019241-Pleurochrysis_carterae.AAC.3